jgi:hypothetical protein
VKLYLGGSKAKERKRKENREKESVDIRRRGLGVPSVAISSYSEVPKVFCQQGVVPHHQNATKIVCCFNENNNRSLNSCSLPTAPLTRQYGTPRY